jgi:hypothetical protein
MSGILTDTEKAIVETIRMRLSTEQALHYLKDIKFSISRATYFRHKKKLEEKKLERLYHIANIEFEDQHLARIDGLELIEKKMWEEYNKEEDPCKRVQILKDIAHIQPYLSSYYEATKYIVNKRTIEAKEKGRIIELNKPSLNDPKTNKITAISVNNDDKETNSKAFDKNKDLNDTSFIDKMISETTDPEIIAQLEKQKRNRIFY